MVALKDSVLKVNLPLEAVYQNASMLPSSQSVSGAQFMLGTVPAQSQGALTVEVRVSDTVPANSVLVFNMAPEFRDPANQVQSANTFLALTIKEKTVYGAGAIAGLFGSIGRSAWSIIFLLALIVIFLAIPWPWSAVSRGWIPGM